MTRRWFDACVLGGWLPMAAIACDQRQEMATDAADPASPSVSPTAGASIASAAAAPSRAAALPARTTRGQMLGHYADTAAMRRALVAGKLAEYRAAAATVAGDDWTPSGAPDTRALADRARAAAAAAQVAPSLVEAAQALGELGGACAACHLASGAPVPPIAPDEPSDATNPRMLAHAVASDRLWAGLTLPSDESWAGGIQLLLQDPRLTDESAEGMSAARLLLELARRGEGAEPDQRGQLMADISLTCSGCHERLGVVLVDGVVAR